MIFYLSQGATLLNTLSSFDFKTELNASPFGAIFSRFVRCIIPVISMTLMAISMPKLKKNRYNLLCFIIFFFGFIVSSLTGFRGYFISFYVTPFLIFFAPLYIPACRKFLRLRIKKRSLGIIFLGVLAVALLIQFLIINTRNLYDVDLLRR